MLNCEVSGEDLESIIFKEVLEMQRPDLKRRLEFSNYEISDLRRGQRASEAKGSEAISSLSGVSPSQLIQELNDVQETYSRIKAMELKRRELAKELAEVRAFFGPLTERVGKLFDCLKKVRTLDSAYVFTLAKFLRLFKESLLSSGKIC